MKKLNQRGKNTVKVSIDALKTRNAMEEESEKYNFFQAQGFSFKKWEVRPFTFQGKSTEALRGHRC